MAVLKDNQKTWIVTKLAHFVSPGELAVAFKEEFGADIQIHQIVTYDPTRAKFAGGARWKTLFDAMREDYLKNVDAVPGSHQAFRMNMLQQMAADAFKRKNYGQAQSILKQMAEEVGGVLTNQKHVTVEKTGGLHGMEPEERRDRLRDLLAEALSTDAKQTAPSTTTAQ